MTTGDDTRPDGRTSTPETLRLRAATRALRLHLDELPIDYDQRVPPDKFLAGLAFMFARNRYACAESLIGSGFGGTVMGALARSVLVEGLRWLWIAQDSHRRTCLLGQLLEERNRIAALLNSVPCPTLTRFLMPVPPIADLTGASRVWLGAPSMPDDDSLLDALFATPITASEHKLPLAHELVEFLAEAHHLLDLAGLRGAAMVLAHAGHGNHLGQRSTLTQDGTPGFDLRADHEALFMHAAAAGAFAVLVGAARSVPDAWPHDIDRTAFLTEAAELANEVGEAAMPVHGLSARAKPGSRKPKETETPPRSLLLSAVMVENSDVHAEPIDIDVRLARLSASAEAFFGVVMATPPVTPTDGVVLHATLTYGSTLSNLQTVMATYEQPGGQVMSAFAARALLEEAARLNWRYSVQGDEFKDRAKQFFDEYRARQRKTIRILVGNGISRKAALRLFDLPPNVLTPPGVDNIAPSRTPIPSVASMLQDLGAGSEQANWLEATYALLSQITHATSLGHLHCLRYLGGKWIPNHLSVEMFALVLDAAALGSAHLIGIMGLLFNDVSEQAQDHRRALMAAAHGVHIAARQIHGLDLPRDRV